MKEEKEEKEESTYNKNNFLWSFVKYFNNASAFKLHIAGQVDISNKQLW